MALVQVSSSDLKSAANELRQLNSNFHTQVEALVAQQQKLNGQWEGEAHDMFNHAFNTDKVKWDQFHAQVEEYALALDNIAIEYANKESANLTIASERKGC